MKKSLIFTVPPIHSIPPRHAAAVEWWVYNVASRLPVSTEIICIRKGEVHHEDITPQCSIYRIGIGRVYKRIFQKWTRWDPLSYAWRLARRASRQRAERQTLIVHNSIHLYTAVARYYPEQDMILHMHNMQNTDNLSAAVKIITPSQFLARWYQEKVPGADIKVVPNGIDVDLYASGDRWSREQFGLTEADTVILYAGRLSPEKGPLELMQAVHQLNRSGQQLKLVVIGDPKANNSGPRAKYQKEIREMAQIMGSNCILVGSVAPADMHKVYTLGNLTVVPSRFEEPFCMVALESMASGTPVLVSPRGGISEFVIDGKTGFILREPLSATSMAEDIQATLKREDHPAVARYARKEILSGYGWQVVTDKLSAILQNWR
ncbi:UDP-N-acetylglucosamine:(glucosyl)LPS alpha-1,2-N-acetylglucosaminyltransferase [Kosakonia radicincitans]|uniref:glycosyltransferase n=1 Tax=Kosakonia radicincitans TaxID=283686 RepID=UPI0009C2F0BD|nr:glycosyltransferase [Kosakonia radicincitans]SKC12574.1 UDP-N-acetylglucosamine:(glucosyl)LPS alpha-1,2-N-acetylglucosaminyltransferase [Kosakonia radicincitans]